MSSSEKLLDAVDAVVYGDLFDCAVTFEEIWRFSRVGISRDELRALLEESKLQGVIAEDKGFFCLAGRKEGIERRAATRERADRLRRRAGRVARVLRHAPFVRGLMLTGSVAAGSARLDADVDFLVVVARRRLFTVFLLFGSMSRLIGRNVFCPNYYLSEDHLAQKRRDIYVAREVAQASPLTKMETDLRMANPWIVEFFPNLEDPANDPARGDERGIDGEVSGSAGALQRVFEFLLHGRLGEWVEARARGVANRRLQAHYAIYSREVPESVSKGLEAGSALRFHGNPLNQNIQERYVALREKMGGLLRDKA